MMAPLQPVGSISAIFISFDDSRRPTMPGTSNTADKIGGSAGTRRVEHRGRAAGIASTTPADNHHHARQAEDFEMGHLLPMARRDARAVAGALSPADALCHRRQARGVIIMMCRWHNADLISLAVALGMA